MKRNQRCMRWLLSAGLTLGLALVLAPTSQANTPDGEAPAEESVCDGEENGKAWGLCNAYCEAMDCDADPTANAKACEKVEALYLSNTGNESRPCEEGVVECPCLDTWENGVGALPLTSNPYTNPVFAVSAITASCSEGNSNAQFHLVTVGEAALLRDLFDALVGGDQQVRSAAQTPVLHIAARRTTGRVAKAADEPGFAGSRDLG